MGDYLHDGLAAGTTNSDNMPQAPANDYDRVLWQNNNDHRDSQRRMIAEIAQTPAGNSSPLSPAQLAMIEKDAPHLTELRLRNAAVERRFNKACGIIYVLMFSGTLTAWLSESSRGAKAIDMLGNLLIVAFVALLGTGVVAALLKPLLRRWPTK